MLTCNYKLKEVQPGLQGWAAYGKVSFNLDLLTKSRLLTRYVERVVFLEQTRKFII